MRGWADSDHPLPGIQCDTGPVGRKKKARGVKYERLPVSQTALTNTHEDTLGHGKAEGKELEPLLH